MTDLERYLALQWVKLAAVSAEALRAFLRTIWGENRQRAVSILETLATGKGKLNPNYINRLELQGKLNDPATRTWALKALGKGTMQEAGYADDAERALTELRNAWVASRQAPYKATREQLYSWIEAAQKRGMTREEINRAVEGFFNANKPVALPKIMHPRTTQVMHRGITPGALGSAQGAQGKQMASLMRERPEIYWDLLEKENPELYNMLSAGSNKPVGLIRNLYRRTPKWALLGGGLAGGMGINQMFVANPRVDRAYREGFGQATGQLTPLISALGAPQGAWSLPAYARQFRA